MNNDWRDNPAIMVMVEAALLGVIRAHGGGENEGERLRAAKMALFGIDPPRGKPKDHDLPELLFMAKEYVRDRGSPEFGEDYIPSWPNADDSKCRSKTALAQLALTARRAADPGVRIHNEQHKIRNLEQKFTLHRDGLLRLVVGWGALPHDDIIGPALRDVQQLLSLLGIPFALPTLPSRDVNSMN